MRRNGPVFLLMLLAVLLMPGAAGAALLPVGEIAIEGAGRTRHSIIRQALGLREGQPVETAELKSLETTLEARLYKLKVFSGVDVITEVFPDRVRFVVRLEEKWTLLPLPFVSYYEKQFVFGAGLIESNFLGTLNPLGGVFMIQGGKPGGVLFTSLALDEERAWLLGVNLRSVGRRVITRDVNRETGRHDERTSGGSLQLTRQLGTDWKLGLKFEVSRTDFSGDPGWVSATGIPVEVSLVHDGLVPVEDRTLGWQFRLAGLADTGLFGSHLRRTVASASWLGALPVGSGSALVLAQNFAVGDGFLPGHEFRLGGRASPLAPQLRGYHYDQFLTDAFMISSAELRVPVWSTRALIGSLVPFFDHALYRDAGAASGQISTGLAFRIYLRRIVFPALSVYAAWAAGNEKFTGGGSFGMQF